MIKLSNFESEANIYENNCIICFGPSDWWYMNPSCTKHLMRRLSDKNRILYINPISSDMPSTITKGLGMRIKRKLKSMLTAIRRDETGIVTYSPVFLPIQGNSFFDKINDLSVRLQIKFVLMYLRMNPNLVWIENIRASQAPMWFAKAKSIFHFSDKFSNCPYTRNKDALKKREIATIRNCDIVISTSLRLHQHTLTYKSEDSAYYLPHGVDYELFSKVKKEDTLDVLNNIPRSIVGYYGTLTAENDIELLEYISEDNKDISFVFIGNITAGNYEKLKAKPNVYFLGYQEYIKIPSFANAFDVCILPWKVNTWIEYCNPLKFMEYMASGKPIVSVPIPEVEIKGDGYVSIASNESEFSQAIRKEINADTVERIKNRQQIARQHDWKEHANKLNNILFQLGASR